MIGQREETVLDRAIVMAVQAHSGTMRKKEGIPYILHPMEATVIAGTLTDDIEVLAAAVLHDTVEDTGLTLEEIRAACGERVAALVASETENKRYDLPQGETWKIRKQESLEELRNAESRATRILWMADKLSNMRSIYRLWLDQGDALWNGFNENRVSEQAWYYRSVAALLADLRETEAWKEYNGLVETIFGGQNHAES